MNKPVCTKMGLLVVSRGLHREINIPTVGVGFRGDDGIVSGAFLLQRLAQLVLENIDLTYDALLQARGSEARGDILTGKTSHSKPLEPV